MQRARHDRRRMSIAHLLGAATLAGTTALPAQEAGDPPAQEPAQVEPEQEEPPPGLEVHGFLTQAWASTDGNQYLGIPGDGTTDYRSAALQVRYGWTERDTFVLQLSHEQLGKSPIQQFQDDVEADWVFYERRWDRYAVRVGRVPIPLGLFNEIRDVGTLLPLYRPPAVIYGESAFASETVDGAVFSASLDRGGWGFEADVTYGGWDFTQASGEFYVEASAEQGVGLQLWLRPPVRGLRIGLGGLRFDVEGGLIGLPGQEESWEIAQGSVEWAGDRVTVRAEANRVELQGGRYNGYYGQLVVRLTSRLELVLQTEASDLEFSLPPLVIDLDFAEDHSAGLRYAFSPRVVLKGEIHDNEGYGTEIPVSDIFGPAVETRYGIVGLAVSF